MKSLNLKAEIEEGKFSHGLWERTGDIPYYNLNRGGGWPMINTHASPASGLSAWYLYIISEHKRHVFFSF